MLQVTLVGKQDNWEAALVLESQDILIERHNLLKRLPRGYGVNKEKSLAPRQVILRPHASEENQRSAPLQRRERVAGMK